MWQRRRRRRQRQCWKQQHHNTLSIQVTKSKTNLSLWKPASKCIRCVCVCDMSFYESHTHTRTHNFSISFLVSHWKYSPVGIWMFSKHYSTHINIFKYLQNACWWVKKWRMDWFIHSIIYYLLSYSPLTLHSTAFSITQFWKKIVSIFPLFLFDLFFPAFILVFVYSFW